MVPDYIFIIFILNINANCFSPYLQKSHIILFPLQHPLQASGMIKMVMFYLKHSLNVRDTLLSLENVSTDLKHETDHSDIFSDI